MIASMLNHTLDAQVVRNILTGAAGMILQFRFFDDIKVFNIGMAIRDMLCYLVARG